MNGFRQQVTLDGGPLDGETRMVDLSCSEVTCWYTVGLRLRDYDTTRLVPLREPASYRRSGPDVFTFCRTQADLGDVWPREFYDPSSNLHPYECDGPGRCIHCDRLVTEHHKPDECALCQTNEGGDMSEVPAPEPVEETEEEEQEEEIETETETTDLEF